MVGSCAHKDTELATTAPGHANLIIKVQIVKSGGALLAGGPKWLRQLGQCQLWEVAQHIVDAASGLDLCVLKGQLDSAVSHRLEAVLEGGCGGDGLCWRQEGELWHIDLGVELHNVVEPGGIGRNGLVHLCTPEMIRSQPCAAGALIRGQRTGQ